MIEGNTQSSVDKGLGWVYDQVTGDEDARVCKDIPESACDHQPHNFFAYLVANLCGKIADELASARLVLPWLLGAVGAGGGFAGFLVPIREAGVLVPQLLVAAYIRRLALRKTVWLIGAGLSAAAMLVMGFGTLTMSGTTAGWSILVMLIVYSLARGLCSVSAKDVLGKTVSKSRRGVLMGYSTAISSLAVLGIGFYLLQSGTHAGTTNLFYILLFVAAGCWLVGLGFFAVIREQPGATEGGGNAFSAAVKSFYLLRGDAPFRHYVIMRVLLLSVALLPPFFAMIAQQHVGSDLRNLGSLIIANGIAGALSAIVWGKLSDRSSRLVMAAGAAMTAIVGGFVFVLSVSQSDLLDWQPLHPVLFFLIIIAHGGVRLGRKVYLVDMANSETRSAYVAVSNTVIGVIMLMAGSVGWIADKFGIAYVVFLLSLIAACAAAYALRMREVSD